MNSYTIIDGEEYAKITVNPNGHITKQAEELCRSWNDGYALRDEIHDNLTDTFYMDECGQLWVMRSQGLQYLAKCKL